MSETEAAELALEDLIQARMQDRPERIPYPTGQPLRAADLWTRRDGEVRRGRASPRHDRGRGNARSRWERTLADLGVSSAVGQRASLGSWGVRDAVPARRVRDAAGDDPDDRRRGNGRGPEGRRRAVPASTRSPAAYDLGRAGRTAKLHGTAAGTARDVPESQGRPIRGLYLPPGSRLRPRPARSG